jgi:hypothetical protein
MLQYVFLLILTISILTNAVGIVYARHNISEQIYKMFGNLTPDNLGSMNFSYEYPGGFSINSMSSINKTNSSIMIYNDTGK